MNAGNKNAQPIHPGRDIPKRSFLMVRDAIAGENQAFKGIDGKWRAEQKSLKFLLSMLTKLPLEQLKIDQSFVSDMSTEVAAVPVVEAIIDMGHNLGLSVIAEGVESEAQWDLLRSKGCAHNEL
jgi:hypothetical protein